MSKAELKLITRTSFPQREDLLADLLTSMLPSKGQDPFIKLTSFNIATLIFIIGFSITSFADDSLFPQSVRNLLGLFTLAFPFLFIGIGIIAPGLVQSWDKQLESKRLQTLASTGLISEEEKDRILFHEAGHFLLGYLCGIPVVDYDISGDQDSGVSILAEIPGIMRNPQQGEVVQVLESKQAGGLLVVAVAGVVSEMLQFGNAFGGKQDFPLACEILRIYLHSQDHQKYSLQKGVDIEDEKTIALLRWAIMKAISLLRLHNRELKVVVQCMRERRSVIDCLAAIEQAAPSSQ